MSHFKTSVWVYRVQVASPAVLTGTPAQPKATVYTEGSVDSLEPQLRGALGNREQGSRGGHIFVGKQAFGQACVIT